MQHQADRAPTGPCTLDGSHEVSRNGGGSRGYRPFQAHRRATASRTRSPQRRVETNADRRARGAQDQHDPPATPPHRDVDTLHEAIKARMSNLPAALLGSITWDQGTEMARHLAISKSLGASRLVLRLPTHHSSAAPTRTPTGCCAATSRRAPPWVGTRHITCSALRTSSTTDPDSSSTTARQPSSFAPLRTPPPGLCARPVLRHHGEQYLGVGPDTSRTRSHAGT
jgi:hypothetical protein